MNQQQQQILWWRQLEVEYQQLVNVEQNVHRNSINQSPFGMMSPLDPMEKRNPFDLSNQSTRSNKLPCPSPHSVTQLPPLRPWNPSMLGMLPTSPYLSDNHGTNGMNRTPIKQHAIQEPYDSFGFTWIWISKIAAHYALQRQTAHFANIYAQIILQKRAKDWKLSGSEAPVNNYYDVVALQKKLQMLAAVCVLIASKIEEEQPLKPVDLVDYLTENGAVAPTIDSILESESAICGELQWNLHPTTVMSWLLMLLANDNPLATLTHFIGKLTNPTGTQDLFVRAVELVDIAFGYQQHADFLPSVIAGSALLVVDQALDVHYIAQILQLDIHVLWECRMWLVTLSPQSSSSNVGVGMSERHSLPDVYEGKPTGPRHTERWKKVEEVAFIQSEGKIPQHLAVGLLEPPPLFQAQSNLRRPSYPFSSPPMVYQPQQYYQPSMNHFNKPTNESVPYYQERRSSYSGLTSHEKTQDGFTCSCASPCLSSDRAYCRGLCQNNWKDSEGPPVYHFKYGWQNVETNLHQMPMENLTYHRGY